MPYIVTTTSGQAIATVADNTVNTTTTSLALVGKNYAGYGAFLNENYVKLLEHFSNSTAPSAPLAGQVWFDSSNTLLKFYTGSQWKPIHTSAASATAPSTPVTGDLWWDTTNTQLKVWAGSSWVTIGPGGSSTGGSSTSSSTSTTTGIVPDTIVDTTTLSHIIVRFNIANNTIAILSKDAAFTPQTPITGFSRINPGLNLISASSLTGVQFTGNATNALSVNNISSTSFMRSDQNTSTTGTLGVTNDAGVTVGSTVQFRGAVSSGAFALTNLTNNSDLIINVNKAGTISPAINVNGTTGLVTIPNGLTVQTGTTTAIQGTLTVTGTTTLSNQLAASTDNAIDIGAAITRFGNVYAVGFRSTFVNAQGNVSAALINAGAINTTGNILATGGVFNGLTINGYLNGTGNISTPQLNAGQINTTGNVLAVTGVFNALSVNAGGVAGFINTAGNISAGQLNAGFINTTGNVSAAQVNAGFVNTTGNVSAAIHMGGAVNITGNIIAAAGIYNDLRVNGNITSYGYHNHIGNISASQLNAGQINTTGNVLATGGVFNGVTVNGYLNGTGNISTPQLNAGQINTTGNVLAQAGTFNGLTINTGDTQTYNVKPYANATVNLGTSALRYNYLYAVNLDCLSVSSQGGVSGPFINTSGYVNALGNVMAQAGIFNDIRVNNTGVAGAQGNITAYGHVNVIGNVLATVGSFGSIAATGFINTSGNVSAAVHSGGQVAVTGLINTAGNVLAAVGRFGQVSSDGFINTSANVSAATGSFGGVNSTGFINTSGNVSAATGSFGAIVSTGAALLNGATQIAGSSSALVVNYSGGGTQYGISLKAAADSTTAINFFNAAGTSVGSIGETSTGITFNGTLNGAAPAGSLSGTTLASGVTASSLTSVGTLTGLTIGGTATTRDVVPTASNTYSLGSTTNWYLKAFTQSAIAMYADLAERFESDVPYPAGTVVELGGAKEITAVSQELSDDVFGVISTNAAYLMNGNAGDDQTHPPVALAGRVPVRVIGRITKGDRLVSAGNGLARAALKGEYTPFNVVGRSLEDKNTTEEGVIEAIVKLSI